MQAYYHWAIQAKHDVLSTIELSLVPLCTHGLTIPFTHKLNSIGITVTMGSHVNLLFNKRLYNLLDEI